MRLKVGGHGNPVCECLGYILLWPLYVIFIMYATWINVIYLIISIICFAPWPAALV